jgi:hypothetical protein
VFCSSAEVWLFRLEGLQTTKIIAEEPERSDRRDRNDRDGRDLQGTGYMNGDRNKRAEINDNRGKLQAKNENGETSRLEVDRRGNVHASDWNGVTGRLLGNTIEWDNGTTWRRG